MDASPFFIIMEQYKICLYSYYIPFLWNIFHNFGIYSIIMEDLYSDSYKKFQNYGIY